ncbi:MULTISPECIES: hypothetical protein [Spirosoma]|uniref:Uncharacterized protein n=1 Tax=Spirosoma sordidisoli TaxID=2502893 RepID=A0A4V1RVY9_9BACT|nr:MULTISPECIES: hypothetical protein [Spirosoma]RYC68428.1 hypothetical protein EQG79_18900 [Spirosoma sordidisoli]
MTVEWVADSDADGVDDAIDLCPGTPANTEVNDYGCPIDLPGCDYTTSTVTLASTGGSSGSAVSTRYVLADNSGVILQINPTASFTGLSGTATYMALALTYEGAVSNLQVGNLLSDVSASCMDWSNALVFKACVQAPVTCDYQIGQTITLRAAGGSTGPGTRTSYVLTDATGKLVKVSSAPSFSTADLTAGTYMAYALTYTDDNSIANLVANGTNTISQVTASCLAKSPALSLTICGCPTAVCVPLIVSRVR